MSDDSRPQEPRSPRVTSRGLFGSALFAALLFVLLAGGAVLTTSCHPRPFGHHGPEHMLEHAQSFADWLLYRVDATDQQKAEVQTILEGAITDLAEARPDHDALHAAVVAELTKPSIDRNALEALRADRIQAIDGASQRIVVAIADIAEVLTQEQRQELAEMSERFHRFRRWHR